MKKMTTMMTMVVIGVDGNNGDCKDVGGAIFGREILWF